MLSKMFYIGVLTPACITVAFFVAFLICWFKCGLREKFLRKRYPEHFNKNEPNVQFTDLTYRNRNCGFTERDVPESDGGRQLSTPSSTHSYETMADSHSAAESDHSSISNSSTQRMLGVGSKEDQRRSQPHFEPKQTALPTFGESPIYGVQRQGWNYPTQHQDYITQKHTQQTINKQNDKCRYTNKQSSNNAEAPFSTDSKNITQEWIKNYRCSSLEDHYKHCVIGIHNNSDIKTSNYVPGNYVSSSYPEAPKDITRGQQYLQSQIRDFKGYHPPPPDVTYNHPPARPGTYIPRSLSDTYGMFVTPQNYPQVHSGPNYYQGIDTDSEYNRDYMYQPPSQNEHRVAIQMVS
ncbi:unnamed protein product [Owenia fusiformis]|uniref:Uncharacterized protein n=1 Tax=Owenia fusiformis TaxID=6347 RepID=A0A8J1Y6R5_OWEFU|nr:unnamed protein product [Owenia fusiformis]